MNQKTFQLFLTKPCNLFLGLTIMLMVFACTPKISDDNVVVAYQDKVLTQEDVLLHLSKMKVDFDTLTEIEHYKKDWLSKQIIIAEANERLPNKETNIQEELLQYKSDLLYFKYVNYYIENKLNKQVSIAEIDSFYNTFSDDLRVTEPLFKSLYIEVPKTVKDAYKIRYWVKSSSQKHQEELNLFCYQNAKIFDDFDGQWTPYGKLLKITNISKESALKSGQIIETETDSVKQFLYIYEMVKHGEIVPRDYADKMITEMIVNQRKNKLQTALQSEINTQVRHILKTQ